MSRDPNRIEVLLEKVNKLWKANPDWRMGQLIDNACFFGMKEKLGIKTLTPSKSFSVFNIEDDIFELGLDALIKEYCNG